MTVGGPGEQGDTRGMNGRQRGAAEAEGGAIGMAVLMS